MSGGVAVHARGGSERIARRIANCAAAAPARTDATVATSAAHSSFSIMRAQKSALNSASTTSIFSTSMASGKPLRVPGDMSMLCVMSFIVSRAPLPGARLTSALSSSSRA